MRYDVQLYSSCTHKLAFPVANFIHGVTTRLERNEKLGNKFIKFIFFTLLALEIRRRVKKTFYEHLIHFLRKFSSGFPSNLILQRKSTKTFLTF